MTEAERAYIAGYFDGEGSVSIARCGEAKLPTVRVQIVQKDPEALARIRDELGAGKVYPRASDGTYVLSIVGRLPVRRFARIVYPFVRQKKRQVALAYLAAGLQTNRTPTPRQRERRERYAREVSALNRGTP